jgi:hypothetical protein
MKPATTLATLLLALVSLGHLLRLAFRVEANVGGSVVPMWVSVLGCLVSGGLAFALWRESRGR